MLVEVVYFTGLSMIWRSKIRFEMAIRLPDTTKPNWHFWTFVALSVITGRVYGDTILVKHNLSVMNASTCYSCKTGEANFPCLDQSVESVEQKVWETAVAAQSLCFLRAFAWMWDWGVRLMKAIVSTSSAAWVMAFGKQAVFCCGLPGTGAGCHGTASPPWLIGEERGGGAKPAAAAATAVSYQWEASHSH